MTREAALMGVPTYSVFAGAQPAVDRAIERQGHLHSLQSAEELVPVSPRLVDPRPMTELRPRATGLVERFVEAVLAIDA
jgi:predicted glycosyltransferase